ncbi:MAG: 3-dehydroquinate synthase [Candidatus Thorarchaeota archaeon]|nr:3-dehydroquinate synthase [Candidatus Thorarchaeota archaeon]
MKFTRFEVNTNSRKYPVIVGHDILNSVGEFLDSSTTRVFVISDDMIPELYLDSLIQGLEASGIETTTKLLKAGESLKTLETVKSLYDFLGENLASRSDTIVALGGGVIGDTAGFVASTFKRGLNLVQVPTTLLAQVDSAIGGKTGVNLEVGKNLVGTFYQPHAVIVDVSTLSSLPSSDFVSGLAEVIKYGFIMDKKLFQILIDNKVEVVRRDPDVISKIVERALRNKARIVEADEREERGKREILNFGHTVGHAIETYSNHSILHGQAVAIGMVEEARITVRMGLLENSVLESLIFILSLFGLPTEIPNGMDVTQLNSIMLQDKKVRHGRLMIPMLVDLGKTEMKMIDLDNNLNLIRRNGVESKC